MPVSVTQQTTTVSSSGGNERLALCAFNFGYLKTPDGWIKIAQVIVGLIVMSLLIRTYNVSWVLFLMMTAFAFAVVSFIILLSAMGSYSGSLLIGTLFYLNYHIVGFIFYLSGGLTCVVNASQYVGLGSIIAAGVLGLIASALYAVDVALTVRARVWIFSANCPNLPLKHCSAQLCMPLPLRSCTTGVAKSLDRRC